VRKDKVEVANCNLKDSGQTFKMVFYFEISGKEQKCRKTVITMASTTLSYLKLTDKKLGFKINFWVPLIKDGIKRLIL
jgi:hypothetical protein